MAHELNPEDPLLTSLRGQWQEVVVMMMRKKGIKNIRFKPEDFAFLQDENHKPICITHGHKDGFSLILCENEEEANAYMRAHPEIIRTK